jgi:hypothetical protein
VTTADREAKMQNRTADDQAHNRGVSASKPGAGKLSSKLQEERRGGAQQQQGNERMMVRARGAMGAWAQRSDAGCVADGRTGASGTEIPAIRPAGSERYEIRDTGAGEACCRGR